LIILESASAIIDQNAESKVPIHQLLLAQYGRKVARGGPECKHSKQTEAFVLSIRQEYNLGEDEAAGAMPNLSIRRQK
jgi:hypothetical protein